MEAAAVSREEMGSYPKCVEEIMAEVIDGREIPERYLNSDEGGVDRRSIPLMDAPAIDMGLLLASSPQELTKLRSVLTSWGCFQLVNHGMSIEFLDQVRRATREFFGLPREEKAKYARTDDREGYGTDNVYEGHSINWNDRLHLVVYPERQRKLHLWPQIPNFREMVHEFTLKSRKIVLGLLREMAVAVELEEKTFLEQYGEEGLMFGRFNYYPPCPRSDAVLGIKPHSDGTAITVLVQDDKVEALQVQRDESWFRVPILPHALFINVGDQMEVMSNGLFKSAFHKVTTNQERDRISMALLCFPELHKEIGPAMQLVTAQTPQRFNKFVNYSKIFWQVDPTDKRRPIDLLKRF